jgi:hypothetical protein
MAPGFVAALSNLAARVSVESTGDLPERKGVAAAAAAPRACTYSGGYIAERRRAANKVRGQVDCTEVGHIAGLGAEPVGTAGRVPRRRTAAAAGRRCCVEGRCSCCNGGGCCAVQRPVASTAVRSSHLVGTAA